MQTSIFPSVTVSQSFSRKYWPALKSMKNMSVTALTVSTALVPISVIMLLPIFYLRNIL